MGVPGVGVRESERSAGLQGSCSGAQHGGAWGVGGGILSPAQLGRLVLRVWGWGR